MLIVCDFCFLTGSALAGAVRFVFFEWRCRSGLGGVLVFEVALREQIFWRGRFLESGGRSRDQVAEGQGRVAGLLGLAVGGAGKAGRSRVAAGRRGACGGVAIKACVT
jgi:hypothetical protein